LFPSYLGYFFARRRAEQLAAGGDELGPGREAECVLLRNPLLSSPRSMGPHSTKNDTRGGLNLTLGRRLSPGLFRESHQSSNLRPNPPGRSPCLEQNRSLSLIAAQAGIPYRTIHRCLNRYRRFGLAVLTREPREDRGKRLALSPGLLDLEIAEALALEAPSLPIAAIYRRGICQVAQDIGSMVPSYDVVYVLEKRFG